MTSISRPCARLATSEPTLPRPITPSVLPRISVPTKFARVHSPRFTDASAWGTDRASAKSRAIVCSAAATRIFAKVSDPALASGRGHALHRRGDRGDSASIRRRDVELLQDLLDRPDHLHDVALGDRAQVTDPDHLARHLALASGDHDP